MASASRVLLIPILLCLLVSSAVGREYETRRGSDAEQCRLQRLTVTKPSRRIESEGGLTETGDEDDDQFQCAGVAAMRNIIRPNCLSLPNFHPSPRLVYIEKGSGLLGIVQPGCAETYQSEQAGREGSQEGRGGESTRRRDQHQKVHRVREGDVVLLLAGVTHFCYNDGDEDLVAISVSDLQNQANQLDRTRFRAFYLAGRVPRNQRGSGGSGAQEQFQNIFDGLDEDLTAEAFKIPNEVVRKMQRDDERGLIVKVRQEDMRMIHPDEGSRGGEGERDDLLGLAGQADQGLLRTSEQNACTLKITQNIDSRREAYIYGERAGRLTVASQQTLPALRVADMSAVKLELLPVPNEFKSSFFFLNNRLD